MRQETRSPGQSLDAGQYQVDAIRHYEQIFGRDFVSPGGIGMARETIAMMGLKAEDRVLDVGCGLGGNAFVMAREFDLRIDAIDLSQNMVALARQRLADNGLGDRVVLRRENCLELDAREQYAAVYSRDVFLHIADKARLLAVLLRALRPGGKLLFTDYCCGPKPWSTDFADYVAGRGYDLLEVADYSGLIAEAGFVRVRGVDESARFIDILNAEISVIEALDIDASDREALLTSWRAKLGHARAGDHRWGLFHAGKPGNSEEAK